MLFRQTSFKDGTLFQKIVCFVLAFFIVDGIYKLARAPLPPGPTTPTSLVITLNSVEIAEDARRAYSSIINIPATIDVVQQTGLPGGVTGVATVANRTYGALRFTLSGTGSFTGIDPCTGNDVSGADIQLPGSNNGTVVINYMVPHPVTGLKPGYLEMKPLPVASNSLELRLVYRTSNSVVCSSSAPLLRTIIGAGLNQPEGIALNPINHEITISNNNINTIDTFDSSGNNPSPRSISGNSTGLSSPQGLYVDTDNNELGVANSGNSTLTFYNDTDMGNVVPIRTLGGDATQLSSPSGIALDATNGEIVVTNGGNNSVTIYSRQMIIDNADPVTLTANIQPLRTLKGTNTSFNTPCGLYVDDENGEIGVVNNHSNSVTLYDRTADGNVTPKRMISGPDTGLVSPCGIYVDTVNNEIGVANPLNNSITIYDRMTSGNAAPKRTLKGSPTGLTNPVGIYVDLVRDEIGVTNRGNNSLTFHKRDDPSVQLKEIPDLLIFTLQQELYAQYTYAGTIDSASGQGDPASMNFEGYNFVWGITDNRIRQPGDASGALLIPPSSVVFELTDGSLVSNLGLGCAILTPFTHLQFTTNCSGPLILSPYPAAGGTYTINATLFKATTINHLPIISIPLKPSQIPWAVPILTLFENNKIQKIDWDFVDEAGDSLLSPVIYSQEIKIALTRPFASVSDCYKQVAGNASNLVFDSGPLAPDVRSLPDVKNNGCDILLSDVDTVIFSYTDALNNHFVFNWKPL
jgi:DNA-binding beta-propeller fold protein YncE